MAQTEEAQRLLPLPLRQNKKVDQLGSGSTSASEADLTAATSGSCSIAYSKSQPRSPPATELEAAAAGRAGADSTATAQVASWKTGGQHSFPRSVIIFQDGEDALMRRFIKQEQKLADAGSPMATTCPLREEEDGDVEVNLETAASDSLRRTSYPAQDAARASVPTHERSAFQHAAHQRLVSVETSRAIQRVAGASAQLRGLMESGAEQLWM